MGVTVEAAKNAARSWIEAEGRHTPALHGAFFHGSINDLPDDAVLSPSSDVDVMLVVEDASGQKPGKFVYNDVLLEVSLLEPGALASASAVLANYHLAPSFRRNGIIADPTGQLTALQTIVGSQFARREWVTERMKHAQNNALSFAQSVSEAKTWDEQVASWLFACGVTTHVLLVAGLRNPTVRKRYALAKTLLEDYGRANFYPELLTLLGCDRMTPELATLHLAAVAGAFDAASAAKQTPFPFWADISNNTRPVAIGGSGEMITQKLHREAIFWMLATYCRCIGVLRRDASPDIQAYHGAGFQEFLNDLGIASYTDLLQRANDVHVFLPRVWEVAQEIRDANREVE